MVLSGRTWFYPDAAFVKGLYRTVSLGLTRSISFDFLYPLSFTSNEEKFLLHISNLEAFYEDNAFAVWMIIHTFCMNGTLVSIIQLCVFPNGPA